MIEYICLLILSIVIEIGYNFITRKTSKLYAFVSILFVLIFLLVFSTNKISWNTDPNLLIMIIIIFIGFYIGNRIYSAEIKEK